MSREVIVLPVGRVISGSLTELQPIVNMETKLPVLDEQGNQKMSYWFRLAVPKSAPELYDTNNVQGVFSKIIAVAGRQWPTNINEDGFSWKIKDGDGVYNGKPYADYCLGCWLFTVRSSWVTTLVESDGIGGWKPILDPGSVMYTGCHVRVGLTVAHNGKSAQPGVYVNPEFVALIKHDTIINPGSVSIGEVGGHLGQSVAVSGVAPILPVSGIPGVAAPMGQAPMDQAPMTQPPMTQPPMVQAPMGQPPMTQLPMVQAPMGQAPMVQAPMVQAPMGQAPMGQAPMGQAPMGQPPGFTMTTLANGLTREQCHASGFTDQMLVERGLMNAPPHGTILT